MNADVGAADAHLDLADGLGRCGRGRGPCGPTWTIWTKRGSCRRKERQWTSAVIGPLDGKAHCRHCRNDGGHSLRAK